VFGALRPFGVRELCSRFCGVIVIVQLIVLSKGLQPQKRWQSHRTPNNCNFHLMRCLAVGCGLGTIGRKACWDATKSGKLLSTRVGVQNRSPGLCYLFGQKCEYFAQ
jgi:hypothetical protein